MPLIVFGNFINKNELTNESNQMEVPPLDTPQHIPVLSAPPVEIKEIEPLLADLPVEIKEIIELAPEKKMEVFENYRAVKKVSPAQPRIQYDQKDNLVVVNGKPKKIGKHSKYLLDMLTIDD